MNLNTNKLSEIMDTIPYEIIHTICNFTDDPIGANAAIMATNKLLRSLHKTRPKRLLEHLIKRHDEKLLAWFWPTQRRRCIKLIITALRESRDYQLIFHMINLTSQRHDNIFTNRLVKYIVKYNDPRLYIILTRDYRHSLKVSHINRYFKHNAISSNAIMIIEKWHRPPNHYINIGHLLSLIYKYHTLNWEPRKYAMRFIAVAASHGLIHRNQLVDLIHAILIYNEHALLSTLLQSCKQYPNYVFPDVIYIRSNLLKDKKQCRQYLESNEDIKVIFN